MGPQSDEHSTVWDSRTRPDDVFLVGTISHACLPASALVFHPARQT
jgi:hypothetical protein